MLTVASNDDRERPRRWAESRRSWFRSTLQIADRELSQFRGTGPRPRRNWFRSTFRRSWPNLRRRWFRGTLSKPRGRYKTPLRRSRPSILGIRAAVGDTCGSESVPAENDQLRQRLRTDAAATSAPCQSIYPTMVSQPTQVISQRSIIAITTFNVLN